jgi:tRNA A37 N6-isopentenylltransferase MiaA
LEKVDANKYTIEARKEILATLDQGKVPIVEGGSWFYINHLFTGLTETFTNTNALADAKALANKIIKDDGDFIRTHLKF